MKRTTLHPLYTVSATVHLSWPHLSYPFHFADAKVNLYFLSVFITSNTDFAYHSPEAFVTSRKVFGRFCIRYKPVLYTLVLFSGAKLENFIETAML